MKDYPYKEPPNHDYLNYIPGWYYPPAPEPVPKTLRENISDFIKIILYFTLLTNGFGLIPNNKSDIKDFIWFVLFICLFLAFVLGVIFKKQVRSVRFLKHIFIRPGSMLKEDAFKGARIVGIILYYFLFIWAAAYIGWYIVTHYLG